MKPPYVKNLLSKHHLDEHVNLFSMRSDAFCSILVQTPWGEVYLRQWSSHRWKLPASLDLFFLLWVELHQNQQIGATRRTTFTALSVSDCPSFTIPTLDSKYVKLWKFLYKNLNSGFWKDSIHPKASQFFRFLVLNQ